MHRRPLGRGRWLAAAAAAAILVAAILPWYTAGGSDGIPPLEFRAFDGSGILAFLAALGVLALVALPYAAGDRPMAIDRPLSFGLLLGLAVVGWTWQVVTLGSRDLAGLAPDRAPGAWLAAIGIVVLGRAVFELASEPRRGH